MSEIKTDAYKIITVEQIKKDAKGTIISDVTNDFNIVKLNGTIAWVKPFSVSYTKDDGISAVSIKIKSSTNKGTAIGTVVTDTAYFGDVITVTATAKTGYKITGGIGNITIDKDTSISVTSVLDVRTLHIVKNTGVDSITVKDSSGNTLSDGASVVIGSTITWTATATTGYTLSSDKGSITVSATSDPTVSPTATLNQYTIKFVNYNGTVLQSSKVSHGTKPTYSGSTPTRATDAQYSYVFKGWDSTIVAATADKTYTATYNTTTQTYTVTINVNDDAYGSVSTKSVTGVPYGTKLSVSSNVITINGVTSTATPTAATVQYTYSFSSWTNGTVTVTGNTTVTANFTRAINTYVFDLNPRVITTDLDGSSTAVYYGGYSGLLFSVYAGSTLVASDITDYGIAWNYYSTLKFVNTATPTEAGYTWTKAADKEYTNNTGKTIDVDMTASRVRASYTISFTNPTYGSWASSSKKVNYGDKIVRSGNTVTCYKYSDNTVVRWTNTLSATPATDQYTYTATATGDNIDSVAADASFSATSSRSTNSYSVTIKSGAGCSANRSSGNFAYGTVITWTCSDGYAFDSSGTKTATRTITGSGEYSVTPEYGYMTVNANTGCTATTNKSGWYKIGSSNTTTWTISDSKVYTFNSTRTTSTTTSTGSGAWTAAANGSVSSPTVYKRQYTVNWYKRTSFADATMTKVKTEYYEYNAAVSAPAHSTFTDSAGTSRYVGNGWDNTAVITADRNINETYATIQYYITVNANTGCSATSNSSGWYTSGSKNTTTWTISNSNDYTFNSDTTVSTTTSTGAGEWTADKVKTISSPTVYTRGYTVTWKYLTAYPDTWGTTTSVVAKGGTPSKDLPGTVTSGNLRKVAYGWDDLSAITSNRTISAKYETQVNCTINVNSTWNSANKSSGWLANGTVITFTAKDNYAYNSTGTQKTATATVSTTTTSYTNNPTYVYCTISGTNCSANKSTGWLAVAASITWTANSSDTSKYSFSNSQYISPSTTTSASVALGTTSYSRSAGYIYYKMTLAGDNTASIKIGSTAISSGDFVLAGSTITWTASTATNIKYSYTNSSATSPTTTATHTVTKSESVTKNASYTYYNATISPASNCTCNYNSGYILSGTTITFTTTAATSSTRYSFSNSSSTTYSITQDVISAGTYASGTVYTWRYVTIGIKYNSTTLASITKWFVDGTIVNSASYYNSDSYYYDEKYVYSGKSTNSITVSSTATSVYTTYSTESLRSYKLTISVTNPGYGTYTVKGDDGNTYTNGSYVPYGVTLTGTASAAATTYSYSISQSQLTAPTLSNGTNEAYNASISWTAKNTTTADIQMCKSGGSWTTIKSSATENTTGTQLNLSWSSTYYFRCAATRTITTYTHSVTSYTDVVTVTGATTMSAVFSRSSSQSSDTLYSASNSSITTPAKATYTVTISAGTGGSVNLSSITAEYGTETERSSNKLIIGDSTCTATASTGYSFYRWYNVPYDITSNCTITAQFSANSNTVTFTPVDNALWLNSSTLAEVSSVKLSTGNTFKISSVVGGYEYTDTAGNAITLIVNPGYKCTGFNYSIGTDYTINSNVTITPTIAATKTTLSITLPSSGSTSVLYKDGTQSIPSAGDTVKLTCDPSVGGAVVYNSPGIIRIETTSGDYLRVQGAAVRASPKSLSITDNVVGNLDMTSNRSLEISSWSATGETFYRAVDTKYFATAKVNTSANVVCLNTTQHNAYFGYANTTSSAQTVSFYVANMATDAIDTDAIMWIATASGWSKYKTTDDGATNYNPKVLNRYAMGYQPGFSSVSIPAFTGVIIQLYPHNTTAPTSPDVVAGTLTGSFSMYLASTTYPLHKYVSTLSYSGLSSLQVTWYSNYINTSSPTVTNLANEIFYRGNTNNMSDKSGTTVSDTSTSWTNQRGLACTGGTATIYLNGTAVTFSGGNNANTGIILKGVSSSLSLVGMATSPTNSLYGGILTITSATISSTKTDITS